MVPSVLEASGNRAFRSPNPVEKAVAAFSTELITAPKNIVVDHEEVHQRTLAEARRAKTG
jgi:hypothetical protein